MENELVGFAADLLDAPPDVVGTVTSGGTESVLLAVQGARDSRPDVDRPRMVLPMTAHAAFHKAAHYFGVEAVMVPVGDGPPGRPGRDGARDRRPHGARGGQRPVVRARGRRPGHRDRRAPRWRRGVRCHVDACIGGWVLPYAARLGRDVPPWTFAVEGVTSISVDLHKYAYTPKGTSVLLHRTAGHCAGRSSSRARSGPATRCSTRPCSPPGRGGPLAGAWAVVNTIGDEGYLTLTARGARRRRPAGRGHLRAPGAAGRGRAGLDAGRVRDRRVLRRLHDHRRDDRAPAGRCSRSSPSRGSRPSIHLSLTAATATASRSSWMRWVRRSPRPWRPARSRSTPGSWSSSAPSTRPP